MSPPRITVRTLLTRSRDTDGRPPFFLKYRSSTNFILSSVFVATFVDIFLYAFIVPILPFALEARAGVKPNRVQFWVTILLVCESGADFITSPICGIIADMTGGRRVSFLIGICILVASLTILTVARSTTLYAIGRILQGISSTVVQVIGLALVVDTVEKEKLGQMLGYVGAAISIGFGLGPILGGIVYDTGGYYAAFGMVFGIVGIDLLLRLAVIEKQTAVRLTEMDRVGENLNLEQESEDVGGRIIFTREVGYTTRPFLSIFTLFRSPRLVIALWGNFVQGVIISSLDVTLPIFVSTMFGWTSLGSGLIFLPTVLPSLAEPFWGYLTDKYGVRIFSTFGFLFMCPALVALRFISDNTLKGKVILCIILFFVGTLLDISAPALMLELEDLVTTKEREHPGIFGKGGAIAQVFGLYSMTQASGILVGSFWGGLVQDHAGWATMGWTLGLLVGITAVPVAWLGKGWCVKRTTPTDAEEHEA